MAGINKVIIVGYLGNDPEMRTMPNGEPVANISVATSEVWNDKNTGERREATEWHRIILFRRLAEISGQYLRKGSLVYVEGKLKTRKWQDQNGQDRYTTEIQADSLTMLGGRSDNTGSTGNVPHNPTGGGKPQAQKPAAPAEPVVDNFDDDIPFAPVHHSYSKLTIYAI